MVTVIRLTRVRPAFTDVWKLRVPPMNNQLGNILLSNLLKKNIIFIAYFNF